MNEKTELTEV